MTVPLERQKNIADVAARVREQLGLGTSAVEDTNAFATSAQGDKADNAIQPGEIPGLLPERFGAIGDNGTTDNIAALTSLYAAALASGDAVVLPKGKVYHVKSGTLVIPEEVVTIAYEGAVIVASGAGTVTKNGTTVMFRPMGGSQARGLFVDVAQGLTGSPSASPHVYNYLRIQKDQIDGTLGAGSKVNGFFINHTFGGAGTRGGRHAAEARLTLSAPTEADNPDRNYCAHAMFATANISDGGVSGDAKGTLFGANPQARANSGATFMRNITGGEANVGIAAGASAQMRTGWSIVGLGDAENGYETDAALSISNTGVTGAYWKHGVLFGAQNGRPAFNSTSTVIKADSAATSAMLNGIDFNGVTFSTDVLRATNLRVRNSQIIVSAPNASLTLGSPTAANTPYVDFRSSASAPPSYDARIIASGGGASDGQGDLRMIATNTVTNRLRPFADNASSLGDASFRWSQLFAGTATINTSDERLKTTFRAFTDLEKEAILACLQHIGVYQWLDAVTEKGEENARLHVGVPAQRCIAEFESRGLDPWRYAFFCRDRKTVTTTNTVKTQRQAMEDVEIIESVIEVVGDSAVRKTISRVISQPKFTVIPVIDEDGSPVTVQSKERVGEKEIVGEDGVSSVVDVFEYSSKPMTYQVPVMEEFDVDVEETVDTDDYIYGIRQTELIIAMISIMCSHA